MSGHTPGPWHLAGDSEGTMVTADGGEQIAMWPPQGGTIEQCANARLIAAAPDLLDALKMALEAPDDDRSWEDYAIAAIKKADPLWEDNHAN